jgi:hypothetical protein
VSYLLRFGRFWWSFVVGDNLGLAVGAGVAIGLTAWLVDRGVNAWWLMPPALIGVIALALLGASPESGSGITANRRPRPRPRGRRARAEQ